jgi:prepilin-type N-terminal cleavage/methylation domain-containing protein/prepilin-type processing-associated H-X9-DG protein
MGAQPQRRASGFTLLELLVVLAVLAVLFGLLAAAVQRSRLTASRIQCENNLRQLGLALHNYHDNRGALPSGMQSNGTSNDPSFGRGWVVALLPYLDQAGLAQELERPELQGIPSPPVDPIEGGPSEGCPPAPHPGLRTLLRVLACPSDARAQALAPSRTLGDVVAPTSYLGVEGTNLFRKDGVLFVGSAVRLSDITDGTSQTLAVGERPAYPEVMWGVWFTGVFGQGLTGSGAVVLGVRERYVDVIDFRYPDGSAGFDGEAHFVPGDLSDPYHAYHFWSLHGGGANFLFADGSVRHLAYGADAILPALATRAGQEPVSLDGW